MGFRGAGVPGHGVPFWGGVVCPAFVEAGVVGDEESSETGKCRELPKAFGNRVLVPELTCMSVLRNPSSETDQRHSHQPGQHHSGKSEVKP